jgi:type I restriction enzyme, S subunit
MLVKLGDIIEGTIDYRGKTPTKFETGIPVISAANIKNGEVIEDGKYVSEEYYIKWTTRGFIKPGDILITTEAPVGEIAQVPSNKTYLISRRVIALQIDSNKANEKYIYYLLRTQGIIRYFESISHGATVPRLYKDEILELELDIPPLDIQLRIAKILDLLDESIKNNINGIKLLEEIVEDVYKEWFVRLRFPGYQVANFLDGLPEGWKKVKLGDAIRPIKRMPKVKKDEYLPSGNYPIIDQGEGLIGGYINDEKYIQTHPLPLLVFGDHTRRIKYIDKPFAAGADGTQLLYPKNENLIPTYFYLAVRKINLSDFHYSRHFKFLKQEYILIPNDSSLVKYNQMTSSFLDEISLIRNKNILLQKTRDLLLPRLIAGKLSVENLNLDISEYSKTLYMAAEPKEKYN